LSHKWGYWSDLATLKFDAGAADGSMATWVQAMPLGDYTHPVWGNVTIDSAKAQEFADNVNNKVRGQDLDIDYDHKEYGGEAAGWVQKAEVRTDGLWLLVDWTKKAYDLIKNKAYRYFSPEFMDEWTHPKDNTTHQNVLFGGAITNRPFLKDILPINMSELFTKEGATPPPPAKQDPPKGGARMDPKLLRALLQLEEGATDEQVAVKLAEVVAKSAGITPPAPPTDPPEPKKFNVNDPASVQEALKQLADVTGNPAIKTLTDLVRAQQDQIKSLAEERKVALVEKKLNELDAGKNFVVPPVVKDNLRAMLMESPDGLGDQVLEAYRQTLEIGVIDMTERGWQRRGGEKSPTTLFLTAVDDLMSKNKGMTYSEAAVRVSRENPQLAMQYREDSYIPSEGR
jgi:phage I-like protein